MEPLETRITQDTVQCIILCKDNMRKVFEEGLEDHCNIDVKCKGSDNQNQGGKRTGKKGTLNLL